MTAETTNTVKWESVDMPSRTRKAPRHKQMLSAGETRVIISNYEKDVTGFYRLERAHDLPLFRLAPVEHGTIEIRKNKQRGQYCYSCGLCTVLRAAYKVPEDIKTAHIDYRIESDGSIIIGEKAAADMFKEDAS